MTALVVDDDEVIRLFVSGILEEMGIEAVTADCGEAGLDYLTAGEHPFPKLVILDITLPGIDGFETATKIKAVAGDRHLPIIFLTGYQESGVLSRCLSIGDDYIPKPFTVEMVTAKVKAHARVSELYQQLDTQYRELKRYHRQVSLEHELVDSIFRRHIEGNFIQADNLRYHISPISLFNGDVLVAAYGPTGNLFILVGDVTGHGLPAAVGAMPVFSTFFTMARKGLSIGLIAFELNKALGRLLPDNMLMAACLLELNSSEEQVTVWSGGLPPAILADSHGNIKQIIEPAHCPLAMLEEHEFSQDVRVYPVGPDDRVYLFTDGVEESRNLSGEMYGDQRLYRLFDGHCEDLYDRILSRLAEFTEGVPQDDDITLVELRCLPSEPVRSGIQKASPVHVLPWSLNIELSVEEIRHASPVPQIIRLLSNAAGVDVHQDYISTILSELYSNAVEHGLLGLDSSIKGTLDGSIEYYALRKQRLEQLKEGFVEITVSLKPGKDTHRVTLSVKDSGEGFDCRSDLDETSDAVHGRGIDIIRELCETVEYSEGGSRATVTYQL